MAVARLAERQHGVIALAQLIALGLSASGVRSWVQRGRLHPIHRGVYAVGHKVLGRHGRWMAAVLACGEGAVLSHRDAAALWGLRQNNRPRIDVTTQSQGGRRRKNMRVSVLLCVWPWPLLLLLFSRGIGLRSGS